MSTTFYINSQILDYFNNSSNKRGDWQNFHFPEADLTKPVSQLVPDMVIQGDLSEKSWQKTALRIASWAISIVIFPLGVYQLTRYTVQRVAMTFIYPAQSRIASVFSKNFSNVYLDEKRKEVFKKAQEEWKFKVVRRLVIEVNGVRCDGVIFAGNPENKKWVLQATGNGVPIEDQMDTYACHYSSTTEQLNVLMINNPGVGRSEGQATPESMGDAQRAGLIFLESAMKAQNILIAGHSLGGMAISQAILKHSFKQEIKYSAAFMLTFAHIEDLAAKIVDFPIVKSLVKWAGIHSDAPAACKKMAENGLRVYAYQASKNEGMFGDVTRTIKKPEEFDHFVTDGPFEFSYNIQSGQGPILKEAGLPYVLGKEASEKESLDSHIQLIGAGKMDHNNDIADLIKDIADERDLWNKEQSPTIPSEAT